MLTLVSIDHHERQTMSKRLIELNRIICDAQFRYVDAIESDNHESAEFWRNRVDELTTEETQLEKAGK